MRNLITWEDWKREMQETMKNEEDPFDIINKIRRGEEKQNIFLNAIGELKYQMNIKKGIAIEKVIIFNSQENLIKALESIKNDFQNDKDFFNYIKENVKITCFCEIIIQNENTR